MKIKIGIFSFIIFLCTFTEIKPQYIPELKSNWQDLKCPLQDASSLYYDRNDDAIYASGNKCIYKLNSATNTWTLVNSDTSADIPSNARILSMCIDKNGVFYAGSDDKTQSFVSYDKGKKWHIITYPLIDVHSIYEHSDGTIYFASSFGLYKTIDSAKTITKLTTPFTYVSCITSDRNGNLLAGTTGLYRSTDNGITWERQPLRFLGDPIDGIAVTKNGSIYVSSISDFSKSTDDGATWSSIVPQFTTAIVMNAMKVMNDINDNIYFIYWSTFYFSSDNGIQWYALAKKANGVTIYFAPYKAVTDLKGNLFTINNWAYGPSVVYRGQIETTAIDNPSTNIPKEFALFQNYPNPFNPSTVIGFTIPQKGVYNISIFNLLGQLVKKLGENEYMPGNYKLNFDAAQLSSGMYIYQLKGNNISLSRKMMFLK